MAEAGLFSSNPSAARSPSVRVLVNGQPIAGVIGAQVESTNWFGADCFKVSLATGAPPLTDANYWASVPDAELEVQLSLDQQVYQSFIVGQIDNLDLNPVIGIVKLEGRDYTAELVHSSLEQSFLNQTASEAVALIAASHGFPTNITPTSTLIGRYYENDHNSLNLDQFSRAVTEWDFLASLARQEAYDLFFCGHTLVFQPAGWNSQSISMLVDDFEKIEFKRSLLLGRELSITIKSWASRQRACLEQTLVGESPVGSLLPSLRYKLMQPNLSGDQILNEATMRIGEIASHERWVEMVMPGELKIAPRDVLLVSGTESGFDQPYRVDCIRRMIDETGFQQTIQARTAVPRLIVPSVALA